MYRQSDNDQGATSTLTVGRYARISDDDEQLELGVKRQLEIGRKRLVYEELQDAKRTYVDNDKSAFQAGVRRDGFEDLLQDFIDGVIDGICSYDLDRLWRQPLDLERVIAAYEKASKVGRRTVFLTEQGHIDLTTDDGITMARFMVAVANKASRDTRRRVSAQKRERAMQGNSTSNYPAFGWNADGTLNEKSKLRVQAIQDILAGISPTAIAERWRNEGTLTERGKIWKSSAVRRIILAPRNAGFAVYRDKLLLGEDGQPVKGTWEPLVDEQTWRDAVAVIEAKRKPMAHRTKALLSTIARCGRCGAGMVRIKRSETNFSYTCRSKDSGGCARVSINGNKLDVQITDFVRAYLKDKRVEPKVDPFGGQARLDEIVAKIAELMAEYNASTLSGSVVFPAVTKLEAEQRELSAARSRHAGQIRRATTFEGAWPEDDLDKQRAIIRQLFDAIVIAPTGPSGRYNPERVDLVFRKD